MTTAQRLKHLLEKHGHSIREASRISGIPRATLGRILDGSDANLDKWLPLLARAYDVPADTLMGGRNPKSDFEWSIRQASVRERCELALMTLQERVRLTVEFLNRTYPRTCCVAHIIAATGLKPNEVSVLLARWDVTPPDLVTARRLIGGIQTLSGIASTWFAFGLLDDEPGLAGIVALICRATHPSQRSGRSGLPAIIKALKEAASRRLGKVV